MYFKSKGRGREQLSGFQAFLKELSPLGSNLPNKLFDPVINNTTDRDLQKQRHLLSLQVICFIYLEKATVNALFLFQRRGKTLTVARRIIVVSKNNISWRPYAQRFSIILSMCSRALQAGTYSEAFIEIQGANLYHLSCNRLIGL